MTVQFNSPTPDQMDRIYDRVLKMAGHHAEIDRMSFAMDMAAANGGNGNQFIDFDRLLAADNMNFAHDVFGIMRHIDRTTGHLGGCFVPRFAISEEGALLGAAQ